jgi:ribonuclease Y
VERAFAIQAGREIRIIVNPEEIDDFTAKKISRDISKKVEKNIDYPGQIKVMVIRETRSVEFAK